MWIRYDMTTTQANKFSFISALSFDAADKPSECFIPRSFHATLEAMAMVRFGGENAGKIFIQPRQTKFKSLPHGLKEQVSFLQSICEAGFAYKGYVLLHTTQDGVCKAEFFKDMEKVKEAYDTWVNEPDSGFLIFLDTKRVNHGDAWDATVEIFAALTR